VRSTAALGRSRYTSIPSGTDASRMYSWYASSRTTRQSLGTRSRNSASSEARTTVPVGLFGLQTKIIRVRGVIAAAIAARSCLSSVSGTRTEEAAARSASAGYASNERQAYMTSAPGSPTASKSCCATPTEPQPTATCEAGTPNRSAIASVRATAPLSGYRLTERAASAITSTTDGSGPYGHSLEDSLYDFPVALVGVRPGL